jgi:hypothetical protein
LVETHLTTPTAPTSRPNAPNRQRAVRIGVGTLKKRSGVDFKPWFRTIIVLRFVCMEDFKQVHDMVIVRISNIGNFESIILESIFQMNLGVLLHFPDVERLMFVACTTLPCDANWMVLFNELLQ